MLKKIDDLPNGVIGVRASDKLSQEDYEQVMKPLLEDVHRQGRRTNFLYHFSPDFDGFTVGAAWQDFRLGIQHIRLFGRCAIVSESDWIRKSGEFLGSMLPCPVNVFHEEGYRRAIDWLSTPSEEQIEHQLLFDSNVLLVEPKGALSKEDFDTLALTVDPWIEQHGPLNGIVLHVKKFPGWEDLGSMIRHIQFIRDHHRKVKRVALAADGAIPQVAPTISDHFVKADVKHFDYSDLDDALKWASCEDAKP